MGNPEVFRSLNERIAAREKRALEIVCECAAEECTERVLITPVEFYEVQRHRGWYVIRPGHELPEVDRVVVEQDGFAVIVRRSAAA